MTRMTYREATRQALREALQADPRVLLMGEDVGNYGGAYACSKGLLEEFGPERIRDTPLSESTFVGTGIGAAINGLRPIVEVMTVNFSLLALDQIVSNAATLRHMSGGQVSVPVVIRMATGGGRQLAAQHSHSLEVWYAHIPGIKVLTPATVTDARYMLGFALQDPDPVVIFEHALLYPMEGEVEDSRNGSQWPTSALRRPGRDVTLVTYGGGLHRSLEAAESLARDGIEIDVIDLRSLRPLNLEIVLESVSRTHRAVVVDEGWRTCGLAAEVLAQISEEAFYSLDAPPARVCGAEVPMPYPKHLEDTALPNVERIIAAIKELVNRE